MAPDPKILILNQSRNEAEKLIELGVEICYLFLFQFVF